MRTILDLHLLHLGYALFEIRGDLLSLVSILLLGSNSFLLPFYLYFKLYFCYVSMYWFSIGFALVFFFQKYSTLPLAAWCFHYNIFVCFHRFALPFFLAYFCLLESITLMSKALYASFSFWSILPQKNIELVLAMVH